MKPDWIKDTELCETSQEGSAPRVQGRVGMKNPTG